MPLDAATLESLKYLPSPYFEADYGEGFLPVPIVELGLLRIMCIIKNKKDWQIKIKRPEIKSKWLQEIQAQPLIIQDVVIELSEKELGYIMDELVYLAESFSEYPPGGVEGTFSKDDFILGNINSELLKFVALLENIPEHKKDWHPGSDNLVLDIVHPSLFCYVNERSLVLNPVTRIQPKWSKLLGSGAPIKLDFNYLWLPPEFNVRNKRTAIASYINNLHPEKYAGMYTVIANIFATF